MLVVDGIPYTGTSNALYSIAGLFLGNGLDFYGSDNGWLALDAGLCLIVSERGVYGGTEGGARLGVAGYGSRDYYVASKGNEAVRC